MLTRRAEELQRIQGVYGELEVGPNQEWVIIPHWPLPTGWNQTETVVLVLIPPGYPVTPPDNFYTHNDLRLATGAPPGSTSPNQSQLERLWLVFSYHVEPADWHPHADLLQGHNLLTFLAGVATRLAEVS